MKGSSKLLALAAMAMGMIGARAGEAASLAPTPPGNAPGGPMPRLVRFGRDVADGGFVSLRNNQSSRWVPTDRRFREIERRRRQDARRERLPW